MSSPTVSAYGTPRFRSRLGRGYVCPEPGNRLELAE